MRLSIEQINKILKKYPNAKKIAVENFLFTKDDDNILINLLNLEGDAELYNWNEHTICAIKEGIYKK